MDWFFEAIRDSAAADFVKGIAELAAGNWDYAAASEEADKLVSSVFGNWQEQINTFANNSTSKYGRARLAKGEETIMK